MILLDKVMNEASHRRQTKQDISKRYFIIHPASFINLFNSTEEKLLLTAHNTCALLSLRGVTSIVTNQWYTNQKETAKLLLDIHEIMANNRSPSEAIQYPYEETFP